MKVRELFKKVDFEKVYLFYEKEIQDIYCFKNIKEIRKKLYPLCKNAVSEIIKLPQSDLDQVLILILNTGDTELKRYDVYSVYKKDVMEQYKDMPFENISHSEYIPFYGIDFEKWEHTANMDICPLSLEYTWNEIAAEILLEMTRFGFTAKMAEQGIEEQVKKIEETLKESEKETTYYTMDEVFDQLYEKYGIERKKIDEEEIRLSVKREFEERQKFFKSIYIN